MVRVAGVVGRSGHHQLPLWSRLGHKCLVDDDPRGLREGVREGPGSIVWLAEGWS